MTNRDIVAEFAAALEVPLEDARATIQLLFDKGIAVEFARPTQGRGEYVHLDAEKIKFSDEVAVANSIPHVQARAEAVAKIALNPVKWFAKPESRAKAHAAIAGFVDVIPQQEDTEPLTAPLERLIDSGERPRAVLKVSLESAPYYWLAGWAWDYELAEADDFKIPIEKLRPMASLRDEIRSRGADATGDSK